MNEKNDEIGAGSCGFVPMVKKPNLGGGSVNP